MENRCIEIVGWGEGNYSAKLKIDINNKGQVVIDQKDWNRIMKEHSWGESYHDPAGCKINWTYDGETGYSNDSNFLVNECDI